MRRARLWFWLHAMDVVAACGGFGWRAYLFCVERAAAADPSLEDMRDD